MDNNKRPVEIDEGSMTAKESGCFGELMKVEQASGMIRKVLPLSPGLQSSEVIVTDESLSVKFCNGSKKVKNLSSEPDIYASVVQKTEQGRSGKNATTVRSLPKSRRLSTLRRNAAIEKLCLVN